MSNLKTNVLIFFCLGILVGAGLILSLTDNWKGGTILLVSAAMTCLGIFWEEIKEFLEI